MGFPISPISSHPRNRSNHKKGARLQPNHDTAVTAWGYLCFSRATSSVFNSCLRPFEFSFSYEEASFYVEGPLPKNGYVFISRRCPPAWVCIWLLLQSHRTLGTCSISGVTWTWRYLRIGRRSRTTGLHQELQAEVSRRSSCPIGTTSLLWLSTAFRVKARRPGLIRRQNTCGLKTYQQEKTWAVLKFKHLDTMRMFSVLELLSRWEMLRRVWTTLSSPTL